MMLDVGQELSGGTMYGIYWGLYGLWVVCRVWGVAGSGTQEGTFCRKLEVEYISQPI